jgi:hypothetical protein
MIQYSRRGKYNQNFQTNAGTKIGISSLKNTVGTSGVFIEHTFAKAITGRK